MTDQTRWGIPEVQAANKARTHQADKLKRLEATMDMVIRWLDSNIDDNDPKDKLAQDSADLKQKIELALDKGTSIKDIEDGYL
jgi:hypothetical protein